MAIKTIFPVTRLHQPLRVDVDVQNGRVVEAWVSATLFRGFEFMLRGRDPRDAVLFTQRICGICSCAHSVAAVMAQQQAFKVEAVPNGQLLTNLIFAADIIQNHLRHFYILGLYDYVTGPDFAPYIPRIAGDFRLPKKINDEIQAHAKESIRMAARAHEMMAVFGAKAPHQQTIMATGVTEEVNAANVMAYQGILRELTEWITNFYLPDAAVIGDYYKEYYQIGAGHGNFLSYGLFPEPVTGERSFKAGLISKGSPVAEVDIQAIAEKIRYSWYSGEEEAGFPGINQPEPDRKKDGAYSWVKAPRYNKQPLESGPLARGWVNGYYTHGVSTMDRIQARALETLKICRLAMDWLEQLTPGAPTLTPFTVPPEGYGAGLTDAMRGALGHWLRIRDGRILTYRVITPSTWNFSARDESGVRGPVEEALIGTPVENPDSLIEVGRVVRSFDPCMTCAVHRLEVPPGSKP